MLTFPAEESHTDSSKETTSTCESTFAENFVDGFSPDPGSGGNSEWVFTQDVVGSDSIMFVHIAPTSGGGAVLEMGNTAYPGIAENGGWTFEWSIDASDDTSEEHEDGYLYLSHEKTVVTTTITFSTPILGEPGGTMSGSSYYEVRWDESDEWDPDDTDFSSGQIPSDAYLVYKESGDLYPVTNTAEDEECKDKLCYIEITEECAGTSSAFTAVKLEGNEVEVYDTWMGDGQAS
jgi:hypothetical protein